MFIFWHYCEVSSLFSSYLMTDNPFLLCRTFISYRIRPYSINLFLADHPISGTCFVNHFFLQTSYSFISFHGDVCVSVYTVKDCVISSLQGFFVVFLKTACAVQVPKLSV